MSLADIYLAGLLIAGFALFVWYLFNTQPSGTAWRDGLGSLLLCLAWPLVLGVVLASIVSDLFQALRDWWRS